MAQAFDNAATGSGTPGTFTVAGPNPSVLIAIYNNSGLDDMTAISFGGVSLTKLQTQQISTGNYVYLWGAIGIPTGSHSFSVTGGSSYQYSVIFHSGILQSSFPDASNKTSTTTTSGNQAFSLTTVTDNDWVVMFYQGGSRSGTNLVAGTSTTRRAVDSTNWFSAAFDSNGAVHPAGSETLNLTFTGGAASAAVFMVALAPTAGTAYTKSLTEAVTNTDSLLKTATRTLSEIIALLPNLSIGIVPNIASGPNPAGTGVDDSSVGTIAWGNPGNITSEDGATARVPAAATWTVVPSDKTIKLCKAGTITGSNKASATQMPNGLAYRSFGTSSDLWGTTLTPSDVNNSGFGVAYQCSGDADSHYLKATNFAFNIPSTATISGVLVDVKETFTGGVSARVGEVDHIRITIYYTTGTSYTQTLTDAITATATLIKTATKFLTEAITNTESLIRSITRSLSEAITATANANFQTGRSLIESITTTSTFAGMIVHAANLTEAITNSDTFSRVWMALRTFTEAVTNSDTIVYTFSRNLVEAIRSSDTFSYARTTFATLTEAITTTANLIRTTTRSLIETLTVSDTLAAMRTFARSFTESITTSDTFSRVLTATRTFTETITSSDTIHAALNGSNVIWYHIAKSTNAAWSHTTQATAATWAKISRSTASVWTKINRN